MKLVIFGLSITSSWGNGHATLWRALCRALVRRGHRITFFERDEPWYAGSRDAAAIEGVDVVVYPAWPMVQAQAEHAMREADAGIVTSYCPDGPAASLCVLGAARAMRIFYDLDTPVTLARIAAGEAVNYLPDAGLGDFDLVLSYTGGEALIQLQTRLGARRVLPLYGSVDPKAHRPSAAQPQYRADLSYLGTYAADRQAGLDALFIQPSKAQPQRRFIIGGALYPQTFPWASNIAFVRHLPPAEHPAFYCSSRMTLNVTRRAMAASGYCPSGRLFEAAACGVPILSDVWDGLDCFYDIGREIIPARTTADVLAALELSDAELARIGKAAQDRTLSEHTADHRARELESVLLAADAAAES